MDIKGKVTLGDRCTLRGNLVLRTHKGGRIVLHDDATIADYCLFQINALAEIGEGSYVGPYCVVRDTNHVFQGTDIHWRLTPHITEPIIIGKNCFIGSGTYLMPGVTIGDGALVAPRSVVTKDVGPLEVWAGSPARMVAHRTDEEKQAKLKRYLDHIAMFGFREPEEAEA
jgi:acetyltransferase-like isoleucine patch superfamily enzyme